MTDSMNIETYLAEGGVLTSPNNVPARYRGELMRLMATFVDSELAGAAGFADTINTAPGIKERKAAAKIVLEKTEHADKVLALMGEFGADTDRYATSHPWEARTDRNTNLGATRSSTDMRLAVFNYPFTGWADAVVMNLLMGLAVGVQLEEFSKVSYQPLAEVFREIAPFERRHAELAFEGLVQLLQDEAQRPSIQESVNYWWPRTASSFGEGESRRIETLRAFGLRRQGNVEMKAEWEQRAKSSLAELGLNAPA